MGMYFDAAVVFVSNSYLFLRLAVAILCNFWLVVKVVLILKFVFSKKATKIDKIFTGNLTLTR